MLVVRNLHVSVGETEILKGVGLTVNAGEVHAVMGPNGSGKSTLANVIAGRPEYTVTDGEMLYEDVNLLDMDPTLRAREGIFLAFQYPVELPGVRSWQFLKSAVDAVKSPSRSRRAQYQSLRPPVKRKDADVGDRPGSDQAVGERGVFGWREEA